MKTVVSLKDILQSACGHLNKHLVVVPAKKVRKPKRPTAHVIWMQEQLTDYCRANGYELHEEYRFHPYRKWRFDFYIIPVNVAVEYEGVMSEKSRHTTVKGYSGDTDKYREAAKMGITVLRYTVLNYRQMVADLSDMSAKTTLPF